MAKIMLVEDDNNLRAIYGDRLLAEGHEIVSARDGEEALAVAVKERPDLIISDVMMPKISGFDMLDILRSTPETKNTKVIMMTALSQAEDKERATTLGADKYLVKSQVTLDDVARVVAEILGTDSPDAAAGPVSDPAVATPAISAVPPAPAMSSTPVTPPSEPTAPVTPATEPVVSMPAPDVSPMSEPPVTSSVPVTEPAVAPEPLAAVPVDEPSVTPTASMPPAEALDTVTEAEEQQEVTSQIDQFATSTLPDTPTHSEVPTTPVETPTPSEPSVEVTTETPSQPSLGQKVIEPLSEQINKPDIHQLYEKEMAAEAANAAVPVPPAGTTVESQPTPTAPTGQEPPKDGDPNAIAL